jgi:hypothetical protein
VRRIAGLFTEGLKVGQPLGSEEGQIHTGPLPSLVDRVPELLK